MGVVVEFPRSDGLAALAERVAVLCRNRLLDPRAAAVSFVHIGQQLDADEGAVRGAVAWLERVGRLELRDYSLRTRPHVVVPAVCRIDDVDRCPR